MLTAVYKAIALLQLCALFILPQYVWKPYWGAYLAWIGGERNANIYGNAIVSTLVLLLQNLCYYCFYIACNPWVESFRIGKQWPWESPKEEARAEFAETARNGFLLTLLNVALTIPLGYLSYGDAKRLGYSAAVETFPTAFTMVWQMMVFMLIEDALFYWGHRTLHHPSIYSYIHKVHHKFNYTVSIAATATHPVEYIVSNVLPFVAGPTLLGAHCATMYAWILFRVSETVVNHSGYNFPWTMFTILPLQGTAKDHDDHHSKQVGNFGSLFSHWDRIMGTHIPEEAPFAKDD